MNYHFRGFQTTMGQGMWDMRLFSVSLKDGYFLKYFKLTGSGGHRILLMVKVLSRCACLFMNSAGKVIFTCKNVFPTLSNSLLAAVTEREETESKQRMNSSTFQKTNHRFIACLSNTPPLHPLPCPHPSTTMLTTMR